LDFNPTYIELSCLESPFISLFHPFQNSLIFLPSFPLTWGIRGKVEGVFYLGVGRCGNWWVWPATPSLLAAGHWPPTPPLPSPLPPRGMHVTFRGQTSFSLLSALRSILGCSRISIGAVSFESNYSLESWCIRAIRKLSIDRELLAVVVVEFSA